MEEFINAKFVLCIDNRMYPADLEFFRVYKVIHDKTALESGNIRIIDESGEDYIYPFNFFASIDLPAKATRKYKTRAKALA